MLRAFLAAALAFGLTACALRQAQGESVVPPAGGAPSVLPVDTTSILKKLTKDVEIGSTVDPKNGDVGPRSLALARLNYGKIRKGDLLVCNFADSAGNAGKGTTIELLSSKAGSKPRTLVQSSLIEGCDGAAITQGDQVYAGGLLGKKVEWFDQNGQFKKTYGSPIEDPLYDTFGTCAYGYGCLYSTVYVFVGDAQTGAIDILLLGTFGKPTPLQAVSGFAVNKASGYGALGPSGFAYNYKQGTLFVADGVDNTLVAIENTRNLKSKDEIVVKQGGKSFTCKHPKSACAKLVLAGSPLDKPLAATLLPNGNIIVANTGKNELVELTPAGQVLATKTVDTGKSPAIFALWAVGTKDSNTALFYTDTNSNTVQELEQ